MRVNDVVYAYLLVAKVPSSNPQDYSTLIVSKVFSFTQEKNCVMLDFSFCAYVKGRV